MTVNPVITMLPAITAANASRTHSSTEQPASNPSNDHHKHTSGAVIGVVILVVAVLGLFLLDHSDPLMFDFFVNFFAMAIVTSALFAILILPAYFFGLIGGIASVVILISAAFAIEVTL